MFAKQTWQLLTLFLCAVAGSALAATDRFDYDPLGRLIRVVDTNNLVTDYTYDATGNLLEVRTGGTAVAPTVSSITPTSLRRNESAAVTITGSGFIGASVHSPEPALSISNVQIAATEIKFTLDVSADATLGSREISISSAAGSAIAAITVAPLLPKLNVDPVPLAIPPDGISRQFTIRLSNTDFVDHTVAIAASNGNITVSPGSVTIPAGQLSVPANITGVIAGQATITLSSSTLGTTLVPVFVTSEFKGITTSAAPILGVVLEDNPQQSQLQVTPQVSLPVGVLVGSAVRGVVPDRLGVGSADATLMVNGVGLETAQTVSIEPNTGITLGSPSVASDGSGMTVPISVAVDAPVSQRRVIVRNASGVAFQVVSPLADRVTIVRPAPQIESIEPLFATPESTLTLTIRGKNLQGTNAILFNPAGGIVTDAAPVINSDGTALTAGVSFAANAAIGDHAVVVSAPGGTSPSTLTPSNTFKVVNEIQQAVTPIAAPAVGVVLQETGSPSETPVGLASPTVGVSMGPIATALSPEVGIVGQTTILTVHGNELSGVSSLDLAPDTGVTLGSLTVAGDGKSVSVPISIASDAPQTMRKVRIMAGLVEIPFASPASAQFQVSLPMPEVDSITPIFLQIGQAPKELVVRGRNFQNASLVKISPANEMTVTTPPTVNAAGDEITVNVSAAGTAAPGARLVTVVTPAGESSMVQGPSNTLTLTSAAGSTFTPVVAPSVGVVKLDESVATTSVGPVLSQLLGIELQDVPAPVSTTSSHFSNDLGIAFGPAAFSLGANGFAPGYTGTLVVNGHELNGVTGVAVTPAAGITLGTPTIAPDGKQMAIPMAVDAAAVHGVRTVKLSTAGGVINFADPSSAKLWVGPGVPHIDSITPILAKQGDVVNMTILGATFNDAIEVTASPATGLSFVPGSLSVNAAGTELSVAFVVDPGAALGSRVIQVHVPGASSDSAPAPANTFTVFPP